MSDAWLRFWDRPNAIYANDRHRQVHYARIADDILATLPPRPGLRVLDFGCGEAREAGRVAARVDRLHLYDAAPSVRLALSSRFAGIANLDILDDAGLAALPAGSVDVVTMCSVLQYVDREALPGILHGFRRVLADDGLLVLADVVPPDNAMLDDVRALLATAVRHGFLPAALRSLASTLFSDYRRVRQRHGLATYSDDQIQAALGDAGFVAERHVRNLGFNPARRTYLARPR